MGYNVVFTTCSKGMRTIKDQNNLRGTMDVLDYFGLDDGLYVTWYHAANSQQKLQAALETSMMIEGDITLKWAGSPNQTNELIMAHPPDVNSDLTYKEYVDAILARYPKGMKLDFKLIEAVPSALQILAEQRERIRHPVWVNADIVKGPGEREPIDAEKFIFYANKYFPTATLSLGWTTAGEAYNYTTKHFEDMWAVTNGVKQPVTFPGRISAMKDSWKSFLWLLSQGPDRTITVWSVGNGADWEGATPYDLLQCRNDLPKARMFYDLCGPKYLEFQKLAVTAGNPLNHFNVPWDAAAIKWQIQTNTLEKLEVAIHDETVMMIEGDVSASKIDSSPVMGTSGESNTSFQAWLKALVGSNKGVKIKLHQTEIVTAVMKILKDNMDDLRQPIWVHADVIKGPNMQGNSDLVDASTFLSAVNNIFPYATVSIGWASTYDSHSKSTYTENMVNNAITIAKETFLPVTFAVDIKLVRDCRDLFIGVLNKSRGYSLTFTSDSNISDQVEDIVYFRQNSEISKVFYQCATPCHIA